MRALLASNGPVVDALRSAFPNALAVYAFGSQMQGTATPESDLDLAILVAGYADPLLLWQLSSQLADIVDCDVDLLDLRAASTVMQSQVLMTGERLWGLPLEAGLFECFIMSEKMWLDEKRAGILADIAQKGTIFD